MPTRKLREMHASTRIACSLVLFEAITIQGNQWWTPPAGGYSPTYQYTAPQGGWGKPPAGGWGQAPPGGWAGNSMTPDKGMTPEEFKEFNNNQNWNTEWKENVCFGGFTCSQDSQCEEECGGEKYFCDTAKGGYCFPKYPPFPPEDNKGDGKKTEASEDDKKGDEDNKGDGKKTEASEDDKKGDDPCFARDTFALSATGEPVPMASLRSGDVVMDGPSSTTRIVVNQHRDATFKSALVEIEHANGKLALTPDHVLALDGAFVPARNAAPGSKLGASEVSRVAYTVGEVINPLTTSGKILTQGGVLATTYPEWISEYMLSSALVPLPLSLSNLASCIFPETTQAYYDALIEPLVTIAHPKHLKAALPTALYPVAFLAGDLALAAGFGVFALASPMAVAAMVAVVALHKSRK